MPLAAKRRKSEKEWKPFLHQEAILSSFLQWEAIQIFLWDCEAVWKQTRYIPWWLSNLETSGIRLQRDGQVVVLTASAFLHRGGSEWMEPVTSSVSIFVSLSCETVTRVWRGDRRIKAREVRGGGASLMLPRGIMTTPFRWESETLEEEAVKVTRIGFPSPFPSSLSCPISLSGPKKTSRSDGCSPRWTRMAFRWLMVYSFSPVRTFDSSTWFTRSEV